MPSARQRSIPLNKDPKAVSVPHSDSKPPANEVVRSKTPITDALRMMMEQEVPNDPKHRTYAELIARKLILMALQPKKRDQGNFAAIREIMDRIDGRVPYVTAKQADEPAEIHFINNIDYGQPLMKPVEELRETEKLQNELPKSPNFNEDPQTIANEKVGSALMLDKPTPGIAPFSGPRRLRAPASVYKPGASSNPGRAISQEGGS